jgi:hypothetical protein
MSGAAEAQFALAWLKARVEDLSDLPPMWSRSAYTHRRTSHVAFCNGSIKSECELPAPMGGNVRDVVEATLGAIREYRATIPGPALLTWRCEPEFTTGVAPDVDRIYCRLAFEPDTFGAAQ